VKIKKYPDEPALDLIDVDNDIWELRDNWLSQMVSQKCVLIKKGMTTDGASIPRYCWSIIGHPLSGWILPHALAHDALYSAELLSRKECDEFLLLSMKQAGVSWLRRNTVWSAVRMFGGSVWSKHTSDSVYDSRKHCQILDPLSAAFVVDSGAH